MHNFKYISKEESDEDDNMLLSIIKPVKSWFLEVFKLKYWKKLTLIFAPILLIFIFSPLLISFLYFHIVQCLFFIYAIIYLLREWILCLFFYRKIFFQNSIQNIMFLSLLLSGFYRPNMLIFIQLVFNLYGKPSSQIMFLVSFLLNYIVPATSIFTYHLNINWTGEDFFAKFLNLVAQLKDEIIRNYKLGYDYYVNNEIKPDYIVFVLGMIYIYSDPFKEFITNKKQNRENRIFNQKNTTIASALFGTIFLIYILFFKSKEVILEKFEDEKEKL